MKQSVYRRLFKLIIPYWPIVLLSTMAALIYVVLNSISVWLTATLIHNILADFTELARQQAEWEISSSLSANDKLKYWTNLLILRDTPLESLKVLCLSILFIFIGKNIFLYIKNILISFVQFKMITELRNRLYKHIHDLSLGFFHRKRSGEISSILINDVGVVENALTTSFQKLFVEPINILAFSALLFIISWKLTLISLIIIPVAAIAIIYIGKSIRRKTERTQISIANIMDILTETLTSMRIVKAFVMETVEIRKFLKETHKYFKLLIRRSRLQFLANPTTEMIGVTIGVMLLWIGGKEVILQKGLAADDFIRFILVLFSMLVPVRQLNNVNIELQIGAAGGDRIFSILDEKPEIVDIPSAKKLDAFSNTIEFKKVHFQYGTEDDRVLDEVSFSIHKGEAIALVGPSGSGKSTIADLIPRFYDVNAGSILIDGIDVKDVSVKSLRKLMGIVTQETILFNDSVRDNIAYGMDSVDDTAIQEAAIAANALEFIEDMTDGFNTIIGERGVKLSGGQRQRIAIARALLKNPPILILDEATSALDTESEKLVQQAIDHLMQDRTVLVIAHRLSTVKNANQILSIEKGRIVESGTHEELIAKGGLYSRLHHLQMTEPTS